MVKQQYLFENYQVGLSTIKSLDAAFHPSD